MLKFRPHLPTISRPLRVSHLHRPNKPCSNHQRGRPSPFQRLLDRQRESEVTDNKMVEAELSHKTGQPVIDTCSRSNSPPSTSSKARIDDAQFLDYLSTDFSYLRRFILASNQMVRLLQSESARTSEEIQAKVGIRTRLLYSLNLLTRVIFCVFNLSSARQ